MAQFGLLSDQLYSLGDEEPAPPGTAQARSFLQRPASAPNRSADGGEVQAQYAHAIRSLERRVADLERAVNVLDTQAAESRGTDMTFFYVLAAVLAVAFLYKKLSSPSNVVMWPDMRAQAVDTISPVLRRSVLPATPPYSFL